jgi:hypothetical protein
MRKEEEVDFSEKSKQGAALFVIFGLTKSGSLWTIVRDAGSAGNPFLPYESYKSNKMEDDKWEYKEKGWIPRTNKTMLKMTAIAKLGEHFKTPIWIVEVESKEVARYTPVEEERMEWEQRMGYTGDPSYMRDHHPTDKRLID